MKKLIVFITLSFITAVLFALPSFSESLELKENKKIILQKKQPGQKQQSKTIQTPVDKTIQTPKQDAQTKKQIHQQKNPVKLYPDSSPEKHEAEQVQNPSLPVIEKQNPTRQVRPELRQPEQLQDKVSPWEQTTPNWDKETYDLEVGHPLEETPVGHPETGQTPGTWSEQNVEQHPGSMPQINTDLEMEQDNSNMTGYIQPDFAVKEVYYENGELKIVIMNIGRRISPPDCPQMAVEFGINGVDNTEERTISQCMDRERVVSTNLAIDWQETDGKKICWVKLDPDNSIQELNESNNNFEAPVCRTQESDIHIIGNEVVIEKSGRPLSASTLLLERGDISDKIEDHRIYVLKLKYDLINYGAQAVNFKAPLFCGKAAVYSTDQTTKTARLGPGERKAIIQPAWFHTSSCLSRLYLKILSGDVHHAHFSSSIVCSHSVMNLFGGTPPDVRILSGAVPYMVKVHEEAKVSVTIVNKGGKLNNREKWDLSCEIIKTSTGEVAFHHEWSDLTTPGANNDFTKNINFVPTETGSYTYKIKGNSISDIFESDCFAGKNEITLERSFNVVE